ncbi:MAG: oxygen-independent coproporphyrinogen III oxidase [Steroidobacteraceae bacterium]
MTIELADALIAKYDVPGPRYTSYPTVPYWDGTPAQADWLAHIASALDAASGAPGASLYVHIPFCRSLCTFCGCNTRITRTHSIVMPYLNTLLAEFDIYLRALGRSRLELDELHLGGGTPTFLDEAELEALLSGLEARTLLRAGAVGSIEVDPRVTTLEQLIVLARHGFRRLSIGVQDFDPRVQDIVNRVQSEACVAEVARSARKLGFNSVNFDLIYGLPLQTEASVDNTVEAVCRLRPDRIALYGYAHVPWIRPGQRRFTDGDVPQAEQRRALYERSRERLEQAGYREVGLDHFALETDALWLAQQSGSLHRNFMGYTDRATLPLIGLGVSAIGDAGGALAQNEKDLRQYQQRIEAGELPIHRGHILDGEDLVLRRHILRLMTRLETRWDAPGDYTPFLAQLQRRLAEPEADGLVELTDHGCRVTSLGRAFLRNLCMAFDARLARQSPARALFSRTL